MTWRALVGEVVCNWRTGYPLLCFRQGKPQLPPELTEKRQDRFYLHSLWIVPLCRRRASSLGVRPCQAPQLSVLLLAPLSSSTKQVWGGPPSKYFGLNPDHEFCSTHRHTNTNSVVLLVLPPEVGTQTSPTLWLYGELCIWIRWKDLVQRLYLG